MAFKGTHNVKSRGYKSWRQRLIVSPEQRVTSGALLVINAKSLKPGGNTYQSKHNIHARISGVIEIRNKKISIKPQAA